MKGVLVNFFGQDRDLFGPVVKLQSLGFFMGVFLGTYTLIAQTLFLNELGDELVSFALLASGLVGILLSNIFTYFQSRTSFSKLCIVGFSVILAFTVVTWFFLEYTHARGLIFLLFAMIYPLTTLFQLVFWGVFGRLFNLKQSKKIIGSIDTGKLLGQILSFFIAPFLLNFTKIDHIQFICIISSLICLVILSTLLSNKSLGNIKDHFAKTIDTTSVASMVKKKYIFLIASFVVLSFVVSSFVEYSFMVVTHWKFEAKDIMGFLGVFNGCVLLTSLLLQTMVNERLINMYGVKVSLLILPVVLIITSLCISLITSFSAYNEGTESFFWFFLLIALSKLVTQILREALEEPAYKLYYLPLDVKIRFNIQARIDGVVKELGRTMGGIIVSVLGVLAGVMFHHYFYILIIVLAVWIVVIFNLHKEYQKEVKSKLNQSKKRHYFTRDNKLIITKLLNRIKNVHIPVWSHFAQEILDKWTSRNQELDKSNEFADWITLEDTLSNLVISTSKEDKIKAAELMAVNYRGEFYHYLLRLLNDHDSEVVFAAAKTIKGKKIVEFIPPILERIGNVSIQSELKNTISSLITFNNPVLENYYSKPKASKAQKIAILEIMGQKKGEKEIKFLWDAMNDPDLLVGTKAYQELSKCEVKADAEQAILVKLHLNKQVMNIVWNEFALEPIEFIHEYQQLVASIKEESQKSIENIFALLCLLYEPSSVNLIRENILTEIPENIAFAIELLDVILKDDIKTSVIAILDTTNEIERKKRIEALYPYDKVDETYVLRQLPLRDYSQMSAWTKACAIHLIGQLEKHDLKDVLMSEIYHPEPLVYQEAARALYKLDKVVYQATVRLYISRYKKNLGKQKINFLENIEHIDSTIFERISFVKEKSLLKNISNIVVSAFFRHVSIRSIINKNQLIGAHHVVGIVYKGSININYKEYHAGDIIDLDECTKEVELNCDDKLKIILIPKDVLFNYMYDDINFTISIFKEIEKKAA